MIAYRNDTNKSQCFRVGHPNDLRRITLEPGQSSSDARLSAYERPRGPLTRISDHAEDYTARTTASTVREWLQPSFHVVLRDHLRGKNLSIYPSAAPLIQVLDNPSLFAIFINAEMLADSVNAATTRDGVTGVIQVLIEKQAVRPISPTPKGPTIHTPVSFELYSRDEWRPVWNAKEQRDGFVYGEPLSEPEKMIQQPRDRQEWIDLVALLRDQLIDLIGLSILRAISTEVKNRNKEVSK